MDAGAFPGAGLQNHLLLPDVEAQVLWAAEVDALPAGVLQMLGQRGQLSAQLGDERRRAHSTVRSRSSLPTLLRSARPYL